MSQTIKSSALHILRCLVDLQCRFQVGWNLHVGSTCLEFKSDLSWRYIFESHEHNLKPLRLGPIILRVSEDRKKKFQNIKARLRKREQLETEEEHGEW